MIGFAANILKKNEHLHSEIAIIDRDGKRLTDWDSLRLQIFQVAAYASVNTPEGIIPVCMERGLEPIVSILGLNLAGRGVAPMATNTPEERRKNITEQTHNAFWTEDTYRQAMHSTCLMDSESASLQPVDYASLDKKAWGANSDRTAYVVFTSGSTGNPKGVLLNNYAILCGLQRTAGPDFYDLQADSRFLQMSSLSFVAYIDDMLVPLYGGSQLYILPQSSVGDNRLITEYINRYQITDMLMTAQLYRTFEGAASLRCVCTGSDRIINLAPHANYRLIGAYGMSETAGIAYPYLIKEQLQNTPIGKFCKDFDAYIINEAGELADEGELCLSGAIASGYLNLPELTQAAFTENKYSHKPGHSILLHTRDIVRRLEDGNMLFINRLDNMLKINGQRVEPGEIEAHLLDFEGIEQVVVKGFTDEDGRSFLCAYYKAKQPIQEELLHQHLAQHLAHYMVPSVYVYMEKTPLNSNGKLDRKQLKMPDFSAFRNAYEAPTTHLERVLCDAFAKVLKLDKISVTDDFIRLGGDSIRALAVAKSCVGYTIAVADILTAKTPREIAKMASNKNEGIYENLLADCAKAPLTDSQMGIYLACMLQPQSKMYNIPMHFVFEFTECVSSTASRARIDTVLQKHPALYARIEEEANKVFMVRCAFPQDGICKSFAEEISAADLEKISSDFVQPFDLHQSPLCRASLYRCENKLHLLLDVHHIIADGTSLKILYQQFLAALQGQAVADEQIDAFSLSEVEQRLKASQTYARDKQYFEELLGGVETDACLIPDFPESEQPIYHSAKVEFRFPDHELLEKLKCTNLTLNTLFMGAFGYTLAKMTGQEESIFIVGERGRQSSALASTVSMMVKTLPVLMHLDENKTGKDLLRELQRQFFTTMQHSSVGFGELKEKYGLNVEMAFVYQEDMFADYADSTCKAHVEFPATGDTMAKLWFFVFKEKDEFICRIEYRKDLYKPTTIQRFAEMFLKSAEFLLTAAPMKELQLASAADKELLEQFNHTALPYDTNKTFIDIFAETVQRYPQKNAVIYRTHKYTYAQLDDLSNRLAAYIHSQGIGKGQTVAVLIPRCEYMAIASLGVMKAGAIYEPMDPAYPSARLSFMCKDADVQLLIAETSLVGLLPDYKGPVLFMDAIPDLPAADNSAVAKLAPGLEDTYVLLYTSGTTGKPKGCMLCHSNLMAMIVEHSDVLQITAKSKLTLYPSYGFDAHMADMYPALANGCELYIIPDELRLDFPELKKYFESNCITHALMTTQVARQFLLEYNQVEGLQVLSMGGESLLSFTPKTNYKIFNLYGPTECTVCVSGFCVDKYYNPIPIGHPTANNHIYVVDSFGRPVPVGVPGEMIISGPQVGQGYLNRPDKTAEAFVPNTFEEKSDEQHLKCYRTGDIVRWLDDGNLVFIGRRDLQVKIRGFRIELAEVERVIRDYPGIKDAAVIAAEGRGGKCIHAYVVADTQVDIANLHAFIRSKKPAYMVPAATMQIASIPLTVNQKLDKRKLPVITTAVQEKKNKGTRKLTFLEEQLVTIVQEIVGETAVDVQRDFTDLGITSISSIQLASRIYKHFGLHITASEILDGANILSVENAVVHKLLEQEPQAEQASAKSMRSSYPLTQTQLGIYLDSQRTGLGAYNIPLFYKLPQDISLARLKDAVRMAIRRHPSMLVYIYADAQGEPACYPAPDMDIVIAEYSLAKPLPTLTSFAFAREPLFHISIISCGTDKYLLLEAHHIISDGTSLTILMEDIDKAYQGGKLAIEKYTACDLALEEEQARKGSELQEAKTAYDAIFAGVSKDYVPYPDTHGQDAYASLRAQLASKPAEVHAFCQRFRITENILFTAVFALTLAKYTYHEDALFATIYNGRVDPRTERLISMLVKTLPVYIKTEAKASVGEFLKNVEQQLQTLRQYDIFSFADAVKAYGVNARVMFIYQGRMLEDVKLNGHVLKPIPVAFARPKTELCTEISEEDNDVTITLEYNSGKYSAAWASGFADAYAFCLASLLKAATLADVEITSAAALQRFADFNDTDIAVSFKPVALRLAEQAKLQPDKIALLASPEQEKQFKDATGRRNYEKLTYAQLDNMANALAWSLRAVPIHPGETVGIMTGRSKEVYISEFGILKSGCTFVFLSPTYPLERLSYICEEASVKAIVTTHAVADAHAGMYAALGIPPVFADDISTDVCAKSPEIKVSPDSLAYMIYTSGSTGKPKGVMITHKGLNNLVDNNAKNVQTKYLLTDVMCAVSAFTFDASIIDGLVSLANGVTLCLASEEDMHNPVEFCHFCRENRVKSFVCTPSFALSLLDCPDFANLVKQLEAICCGGETFSQVLYTKLKAMNAHIRLINGYGPSETTVSCSAKLLTSVDSIDIGSPISNTKIYIMDKQNHILPMGALGELVITGDGVGMGYLKRQELTAKAFFKLKGVPAYKSGDLALISNKGCIEFHGRMDNQVKLRGLRVELGEIESAINSCEGVKNSIVLVKGQANNQYLIAYYTADYALSCEVIKATLAQKLTEYMVPSVFMQLAEMPMTANGKINTRALPEPAAATERRPYIAPSNKIEAALCTAFAEALGREQIGVTDDFFELGGTSLTATKIAMFALKHNIPLVYKDIFAHPTVRQLSQLVNNGDSKSQTTVDVKENYASVDNALQGNIWSNDADVGYRPLGNVLLTGATGFLGMHVLKSLLDRKQGEVYCLLKKGTSTTVEERLNYMFFYYFEKTCEDIIGTRIHCIEGDITDRTRILGLKKLNFATAINCAACVKHFANDDILEKVNVQGVENLVELCNAKQVRLIHISTISVAGESVNGIPDKNTQLAENTLYFHQKLENQYILSKFNAENVVLQAITRGLDGKIMRLGNLMPRFSDGEFQINFLTNGFMRQLRGYHALGCVPYAVLSGELEFSPIDDTAAAILALAQTDSRFTVFHVNNIHKVFMSDVFRAMNKAGLRVACVSEAEFAQRLQAAVSATDAPEEIAGLLAYQNRDTENERYMLDYTNSFTACVLNRLGFNWNITGMEYLVKAFKNLDGLGFFSWM